MYFASHIKSIMLQFENLFEKAILMCPMVVPLRYIYNKHYISVALDSTWDAKMIYKFIKDYKWRDNQQGYAA